MKKILPLTALVACIASPASAEPLKGRAETNLRYGEERSIFMTEFWAPITQTEDSVFYIDLRLMGDDQDNREGNLGLGYRHALSLPLLGDGVGGVHAWIDRRITQMDSHFYQSTLGAEWLGQWVDLRLNGYIGLSGERRVSTPDIFTPSFSGSGIFVDVRPGGEIVEEVMDGGDAEVGFKLPILKGELESVRFYAGGYHFEGESSDDVTGWRTRMTADINSDFQIGARFQRDDERGSQGFLEATIRFPFGNKASERKEGIRARLDESPERDIDIVTGNAARPSARAPERIAIENIGTGSLQKVIHVDNTAAPGGNGNVETPYASLQDAEAAAADHDVIYVHRGDGTSARQDQGITLSHEGQVLMGSGVPFYFDGSKFKSGGSALPSSFLIAPASGAPVITNINANGDGVTVAANDVSVKGIAVMNAQRYGINVSADGAGASATGVRISDVVTAGNKTGIFVHGANGGSVGAAIERASASGNIQHGVSVYDDTVGAFDVDLGGGLGSDGGNLLAGNGLEDVTVDYDGRAVSASGNWWGQAGGPRAEQIYFGAPIDDALVGHWLLDEASGSSVASRIGNHSGSLVNGPSGSNGINNGALSFDRANGDYVTISDYDATDNGDKLTVSYWVNPRSLLEGATHVAKWEEAGATFTSSWGMRATASGDEFLFFMADANFDWGNNYFITSDLALTTGSWSNITFVYDGAGAANADRLKIYKNGTQVNGAFGGVIPTSLGNSSEAITFGRRLVDHPVFGSYFDGKMDDVRIYNGALSGGQVGEIFRSRADSSLITTQSLSSAP